MPTNLTTTIADLMSVVDPFCEKRFWTDDQHKRPAISNPVSACTGLVILLMATFTRNIRRSPTQHHIPATSITAFYLCRASLGVVGAGTIVFHSIDDTQTQFDKFNFRMCDWLPIVLMCANILVLYFTRFERDACECTLTSTFILMYLWACVLVLAVDSATYDYLTLELHDPNGGSQSVYGTIMNVVLLAPLGFTLAYASMFFFSKWHSAWVWGMIALNLVLWVCNAYLCATNLWMSMFHAVYHATIAYTFLLAACLGMTLDKQWQLVPAGWVWPMIEMVPPPPPDNAQQINSTNNGNSASAIMHVKIEPLKFA